MKTSAFKQLIKEAVREVIQEELREILLEAVKAPKQQIVKEVVVESQTHAPKKQFDPMEMKSKYMSVLDDMVTGKDTISMNTNNLQINGPVDNINGALPSGDVSLDMISNLFNKK